MIPQRKKKAVVFVAALVLFVLGRMLFEFCQTESNIGRHALLTEGDYRVVRIVDPITLVVEPVDFGPQKNSRPFRIRLASLDLAPTERRSLERDNEAVKTEIGPDRLVRLRFDRHRFDKDQIPLAYAFADNVFINARLVALKIAVPKFLPDNSAKLQRQIARAADSHRR